MNYGAHYQAEAVLAAPTDAVFAFLDDPMRLVGHMSRRSLMMGGGRMSIELDAAGGRSPGSLMRLRGRFLGLALTAEERVIERQVPKRKTWQTVGTPRLILLTAYRMGFDLRPRNTCTRARISIDYSLPESGAMAWLARWLGPAYARWCVDRMIGDAAARFGTRADVELPHIA
ncbi:SRPBCC family protein [Pelomonas sp. V22]|uniref:SRPBCC family protein n=1 Tax=Pelomonas sp. V22 TaxID=2822139 RepID=UPI0024A7ED4F|nr:SRPBCC family protein [Pelomonas sp. V22]MDI4635237.1 SRPBCC family protein [Pelomonas sp. V22]